MHKHTFLAVAGAFLLAASSAHATTVSGSAKSFAIYVGISEPAIVQFTLESETILGSFDAFSYDVVVRSSDDSQKILDMSGRLELSDSDAGAPESNEFRFDFLIVQNAQGVLGPILGLVSFLFPDPVSGNPAGSYFSQVRVGFAPEPKVLVLVGIALIVLSMMGHKRRRQP